MNILDKYVILNEMKNLFYSYRPKKRLCFLSMM